MTNPDIKNPRAKHDFIEAVEFIGTMPARRTEAVRLLRRDLHNNAAQACLAGKG